MDDNYERFLILIKFIKNYDDDEIRLKINY